MAKDTGRNIKDGAVGYVRWNKKAYKFEHKYIKKGLKAVGRTAKKGGKAYYRSAVKNHKKIWKGAKCIAKGGCKGTITGDFSGSAKPTQSRIRNDRLQPQLSMSVI